MKFPRLYETAAPGTTGTAAPAAGSTALTTGTAPATGANQNIPTNLPTEKHWTATHEGLADSLRTAPSLQTFKTPNDVLKAYVDVQPLIGADKAPIPKDWNDPVQVKAFNAKMGVPEKPEGYDLGKVLTPDLPKGYTLDEKLVGKFQGMALEAGLTPRQAAAVAKNYMKGQVADETNAQQLKTAERAEALNKFKTERGAQFDVDMAMAKKGLINYATPEFIDRLNKTGLGDDPEMIKVWAKVGATLKQDTLLPNGLPPGHLQGDDAHSAQVRKAEMQADPNFMKALGDVNNPNHKNAVTEWTAINGKIPAKNGR
jgi:hypothetical protein